jgi:hypothetical protein
MTSYELYAESDTLWYLLNINTKSRTATRRSSTGIDLTNAKSASIVEFQMGEEYGVSKYVFYIAVTYETGLILYKYIDHSKYGRNSTIIMKIPNVTDYIASNKSKIFFDKNTT